MILSVQTHKICIFFQQWQCLFSGKVPIIIWLMIQKFELCTGQHQLLERIIIKVVVWIDLDSKFEQAEDLI